MGIHVIVARVFLPPPSPGQDRVRHLDGDPANNCVVNLAWGTQKENADDMIRHGRSLRGLKNPNAKLNPKRIQIARDLISEGFRIEVVARLFGVCYESIRRAVNGEQWVDCSPAPDARSVSELHS